MQSAFYSLLEVQWSHLDGWPPGSAVEESNSCTHMDQESQVRAREKEASLAENEQG